MGAEVVVIEENFESEVINSEIPVLVDFWAQWCMPCKMIGPIVEELAESYKGKLKVAKVEVDNAPAIADKFKIISIPTLMVFKDGVVVNQFVGAGSRDHIEALFKDYL
ncbi:MAG: thioredoxin [Spirochaetales bacterium]|nr:thioredoxin [Spirochaetales bacterium]